MDLLFILGGLLLLVAGAELLVRYAVKVAEQLRISPLMIGIVLVGFGTSTPELATSLSAALGGHPAIAIGNVVGSNTANILLIVGVAALLAPIACDTSGLKRDIIVMLAASALCVGLSLSGNFERWNGVLMVLAMVGYLGWVWRQESNQSATLQQDGQVAVLHWPRLMGQILLSLAGIALTIFGAKLLVKGSVALATHFGVPEAIIGVTLVAVGTSLPELVTAISAGLRKQSELVLGNILGSNIYNVLAILGITALVEPMEVPQSMQGLDMWEMLASALGFDAMLHWQKRLPRWQGAALLVLYAGYIGVLVEGLPAA